jgi:pathogenesis-related protein 1
MTLLLALSVACTPPPDDTGSDAPTLDPFAQAFVDAHNDARGRAEPTPDPALPDLSWDVALADVAATWAANCVFEHSTVPYGENLAAFSASVEPADVVEAWFSEIAYYDYASNSCDPGQMCGHYTQVVWRDTTRVGCAVQSCTLDGFGRGDFWVCNYDPPGNWVGELPY